ncbi:MAG: glutathionylspermidine synthase family protein [Pseudomonadota bacterium]
MKRLTRDPRPDWQARLDAVGIREPAYLADRGTHEREWDESGVYVFAHHEIDTLKEASERMREMVLDAVDAAVENPPIMDRMAIPPATQALVVESWRRGERNLVGRYDWSFDGRGTPKLLEINAESPYGMLLASRVQDEFRADQYAEAPQWNSIERDITHAFERLRELRRRDVFFACDDADAGLLHETSFIMDCARNAGRRVQLTSANDIGFDLSGRRFVDGEDRAIEYLYLYQPWSQVLDSELAEHFFEDEPVNSVMLEPIWRFLVSNKAFLAWMWERFEGNELLLPTYVDHDPYADRLGESYAQKPIYGNDGSNVTLYKNGEVLAENPDPESSTEDGFVYQMLWLLPDFENRHPVCCTWEVADRFSGMSVHEGGLITDYFSPAVPHIVNDEWAVND